MGEKEEGRERKGNWEERENEGKGREGAGPGPQNIFA